MTIKAILINVLFFCLNMSTILSAKTFSSGFYLLETHSKSYCRWDLKSDNSGKNNLFLHGKIYSESDIEKLSKVRGKIHWKPIPGINTLAVWLGVATGMFGGFELGKQASKFLLFAISSGKMDKRLKILGSIFAVPPAFLISSAVGGALVFGTTWLATYLVYYAATWPFYMMVNIVEISKANKSSDNKFTRTIGKDKKGRLPPKGFVFSNPKNICSKFYMENLAI